MCAAWRRNKGAFSAMRAGITLSQCSLFRFHPDRFRIARELAPLGLPTRYQYLLKLGGEHAPRHCLRCPAFACSCFEARSVRHVLSRLIYPECEFGNSIRGR